MKRVYVCTERQIGAPANIVYECIANYREHHPQILPPAFSNVRVEQGGIGAGTVVSFTYTAAGSKRSYRDVVAEPEPGRVLTETDATGKTDKVTTFTVTPFGERGDRSLVRIETEWTAKGIRGLVERLFAPRLLRPGMIDELERLDRYAHGLAEQRETRIR